MQQLFDRLIADAAFAPSSEEAGGEVRLVEDNVAELLGHPPGKEEELLDIALKRFGDQPDELGARHLLAP